VALAGSSGIEQIEEIVGRETRAWDTQDVDLLLSIFHPDFVWVWPSSTEAHDPADWKIGMGRFDEARWRRYYVELFATHELEGNDRKLVKIEVAPEGDGAFAVVDIDTRWRHRETGEEMRWLGRVCKVYSLVGGQWKLTMHTGALDYGGVPRPRV
jgi:ketosteroid isomerase-like protein